MVSKQTVFLSGITNELYSQRESTKTALVLTRWQLEGNIKMTLTFYVTDSDDGSFRDEKSNETQKF